MRQSCSTYSQPHGCGARLRHLIQLSFFLKLLLSYSASLLLTSLSLSRSLSPHTHCLSLSWAHRLLTLFHHPARAEQKIGSFTLAYLYTYLAQRGGGRPCPPVPLPSTFPPPPPYTHLVGRGLGDGCVLTGEAVVGVQWGGREEIGRS